MNDTTPSSSRREPPAAGTTADPAPDLTADTAVLDPEPAADAPDQQASRSGPVARLRGAPASARIAAGTTAAVLALLGAGAGGYALGQAGSDPTTPAGSTDGQGGRDGRDGPPRPDGPPAGLGGPPGQDGARAPGGDAQLEEPETGTDPEQQQDAAHTTWYVVPSGVGATAA